MKKELYINVEGKENSILNNSYYFLPGNNEDLEVIYCGKVILASPSHEKENKVYKILKEKLEIDFIFDDKIPEVNFFPVPSVAVFAMNKKGYFVSTNTEVDINQEDSSIFFIDFDCKMHYLGNNFRHFFMTLLLNPTKFRKIWSFSFVCDEEYDFLYSFFGKSDYVEKKEEFSSNSSIIIYPTLEEAKTKHDFYDGFDID